MSEEKKEEEQKKEEVKTSEQSQETEPKLTRSQRYYQRDIRKRKHKN